MKIPKYIQEHIDWNNKLLKKADQHAQVVLSWYHNQLDKFNADESDIRDEEFSDIQVNWYSNGFIALDAIDENLKLLEHERNK